MTVGDFKLNSVSISELKYFFEYRNKNLYWRVKPTSNIPAGSLVGAKQKKGSHRYVRLRNKKYSAARIVYALNKGRWPDVYLIHLDGDPSNLDIDNLAERVKGFSKNHGHSIRPSPKRNDALECDKKAIIEELAFYWRVEKNRESLMDKLKSFLSQGSKCIKVFSEKPICEIDKIIRDEF